MTLAKVHGIAREIFKTQISKKKIDFLKIRKFDFFKAYVTPVLKGSQTNFSPFGPGVRPTIAII